MRYLAFLILLYVVCPLMVRGQVEPVAQRVVVGRIDIEGNAVTRRRVLLRELSVKEGQVLLKDSLEALMAQNKLRLFNLQLFNEVEQAIVPWRDDTVTWHITVKERWYIIPTAILQFADRNINTWWADQQHDLRRVSAGLTVTDKNFRGRLETLSVTAQGGYTKRFGLSYILPYINKDQTRGIGVVGAVAQGNQTYYTTAGNKLQFVGDYTGPHIWRSVEGGLCYISRPGYARRHTMQATYRQFDVSDTIVQLNPGYFADSSTRAQFAELSYRYEYNGVDNWSYSLKGEKLVTMAVGRLGAEGLHAQAFVNVEAGIFREPLTHWYVAGIVRGRLMWPQDQPYFFRNGLGSAIDYVRGYEYYVTDGYNYGLVRFDIKRQVFNKTYLLPVKYFSAMPVRVYPKLFFDAGYINNLQPGTNTLVNTVMYSFGAGVDVVTFYDMKVRVEVSRNHLGQNGLYLHFNSE